MTFGPKASGRDGDPWKPALDEGTRPAPGESGQPVSPIRGYPDSNTYYK